MNVFKRMWIAYVTCAVCSQLVRDVRMGLREFPREYERASRTLRQISEQVNRIDKENTI